MVQVRIVCDAERSTGWSTSGQQSPKAKHDVTAQAVVSHAAIPAYSYVMCA